jgi:DEAD/DEAH box helicase domain-containing protein
MPKLLSSLHAAEHSLIALAALWAMCDRWDHRRPVDEHPFPDRACRRSSSTTATPAGVGITERGFERFEGWVEDTAKMLAGCPCTPAARCVQSPKCGNLNEYLDKDGALTLLRRMLASD